MTAFIDQANIIVTSGAGGNGSASFRREKFVPRGGPNGGDGGKGGSVYFIADHNLGTLLDYRYETRYKAQDGERGGYNQRSGKDGEDLELRVPVGTLLIDGETGLVLADLKVHGEAYMAVKGGNGGWGNVHFKSSVNRAPRRANNGQPAVEKKILLELKLMADVGIAGYPNAGKSTMISKISNARPKIADYPFTTLVPNLGVVQWEPYKSFYIADIPGIIEGASEGKGLGLKFLRHVERTRFLVHLIDAAPFEEEREPVRDYLTLNRELANYSPELAAKDQVVVINKADTISDPGQEAKIAVKFASETGVNDVYFVSAATGRGLDILVKRLGGRVESLRLEELSRLEPPKHPLDD